MEKHSNETIPRRFGITNERKTGCVDATGLPLFIYDPRGNYNGRLYSSLNFFIQMSIFEIIMAYIVENWKGAVNMLGLLISLLIFFTFFLIVVWKLYDALKKDTFDYDIKYLWNQYDTSFLKKTSK